LSAQPRSNAARAFTGSAGRNTPRSSCSPHC
jgi:hypothetical protein